MADKTRAQMISLVLERLGVKSANASAATADSTTAGGVIDSLHSRLRKEQLVNFTTSAFPDWAQTPFADIAASELLTPYGIGGERAQLVMVAAQRGYDELVRQMNAKRHALPVQAHYF